MKLNPFKKKKVPDQLPSDQQIIFPSPKESLKPVVMSFDNDEEKNKRLTERHKHLIEDINSENEDDEIAEMERLIKEKKKAKLEAEKKVKEEELLWAEKEKEKIIEIPLTPFEFMIFKNCPQCNSKIIKEKVKEEGKVLSQKFKCKSKTCKWFNEIIISI